MVCADSGALARAVEHYEACLAIRRQVGARPAVATFNNMAGALMSIGRIADAVRCC